MKVKALTDLTVDGKKHAKGDKFDIGNSAAAHTAAEDGHVELLPSEDDVGPTGILPVGAPPKKAGK